MKPTLGIYRLCGALWGMTASIAAYWQIELGQKVPVDSTIAYALAFFIMYMLVMQIGKRALAKPFGSTFGWDQPPVLILFAVASIVSLLFVLK